jgi:cytochrome P450 family 49 subfamily A
LFSAIGTVLFSTRLGIFNDPPPARAQAFVDNLTGTIAGIQKLQFGLPLYQLWPTKVWKKFDKEAKGVIDLGMEYVKEVTCDMLTVAYCVILLCVYTHVHFMALFLK